MFHIKEINTIKDKLSAKEETIAVAESVTAGLLQAALASAEEASTYFQGGLTAYNIGQKCRHLDINPIHAQQCDCVSRKMAEDMALNICHQFVSTWGVGITGYATPVPESNNLRFAYYAIACKGEIILSKKIDTELSDALEVQVLYVNTMVDELSKIVENYAASGKVCKSG